MVLGMLPDPKSLILCVWTEFPELELCGTCFRTVLKNPHNLCPFSLLGVFLRLIWFLTLNFKESDFALISSPFSSSEAFCFSFQNTA